MPSVTGRGTASQPKKLELPRCLPRAGRGPDGEFETTVVTSARMHAAAGKAGLRMPERPHTRDLPQAMRTMVEVPAGELSGRGERNRVASLFPGHSKVGAGLAPFGPMRIDAAPRMPGVRDEMREFVEEGACELLRECEQARIEKNESRARMRHPRRGPQPGVPSEGKGRGEGRQLQTARPRTALVLQLPRRCRRIMDAGLERAGRHSPQIPQPLSRRPDVLSTTRNCASAL